jgi:hypothetical protein
VTSPDDAQSDDPMDLGRIDDLAIGSDSFVTLKKVSDYNSVVVPLLVDDGVGELIRLAGSAFNIHRLGLWVTARHVIEDALCVSPDAHIFMLCADPEVGGPQPAWLDWDEVPKEAKDGRSAVLLSVTGWSTDAENGSDLALLRAGMLTADGKDRIFPVCRLSARVPRAGTRVRAVGFAAAEVTADTKTERFRDIALARNLSVSHGEVLRVYREGRDTFRDLDGRPAGQLPTACFETSARFDGGMSGGPVVDPDGAVCGIVSKGGVFDDRSFASATPFLFPLHVPQDALLTVYQLAEAGSIAVDEYFEHLTITYSETNPNQHRITYPHG